MTKKEAAIVSAYTGYLIGEFSDMHKYIESIMGRPVYTHEMASSNPVSKQIMEKAKPDFVAIDVTE